MKHIHSCSIFIVFMLLAGCDQMAVHAVQINESHDPVVEPPIVEPPVVEPPNIKPPVEDPDDPIVEDPDDPIVEDPDDPIVEDPDDPIVEDPDDPIVEDPEIPDYVEITDTPCDSKTFDEYCEGNTMVYCGGTGIEHLIYVDCDKYYSRSIEEGTWNDPDNRFKCVIFNDDARIVAGCDDALGVRHHCDISAGDTSYDECTYLDFDYKGTDLYYAHATTVCSMADDGIYRWHFANYDLCSDSCDTDTGCGLAPCSIPGTTLCGDKHRILICTKFKDGNYYVQKDESCDATGDN
ncbi:MAG: hypothetical protein IJM59_04280 [Proteobacteria bacterium]|nr:hypothetical protein [Pseudomonadota bacterium]